MGITAASSTTDRYTAPVLVVGAGPVGLTMACELRRHGVRCRVIDQAPGTTEQSRALVVHARTMEIFADMGLIDQALERGRRTHGLNLYAEGRRLVHFGIDDIDSPYPFFLNINQSDTETLLEEHLGTLGGQVEWRTRLTGLNPLGDSVMARLRDPDGEEEERDYRYVIACDGAHSTCRHELGMAFPGGRFQREFLLADVHLDWDHPPDELHAYVGEHGILFAAPTNRDGVWRVVTESAAGEARRHEPFRSTTEEGLGGEPTFDDLRAAIAAVAPDHLRLRDALWISRFHTHQRLLTHYRSGRVFVAGDAAHLHPPVGAQGMNVGIQDAYNLAWKLALVFHGAGGEELLDSYEAERRPAGEDVVHGTSTALRAALLRHPVSRTLRNRAYQLIASFGPVRERMQQALSMLSVNYRESPLVGEDRGGPLQNGWQGFRRWRDFGAGPEPGDRAPDAELANGATLHGLFQGTAHTLLLFAGGKPDEDVCQRLAQLGEELLKAYDKRLRAHLIVHRLVLPPELHPALPVIFDPDGAAHDKYGARSDCLYLVRPDGYVGFRAQPARIDALRAHLDRLLSPHREKASPTRKR